MVDVSGVWSDLMWREREREREFGREGRLKRENELFILFYWFVCKKKKRIEILSVLLDRLVKQVK